MMKRLKPIEIEQPVEGVHRQAGDHAAAQGLDVVAVGLALEGRAFAEPATRRHAGERHGLARLVAAAHLQQALDDAEPVRDRAPDAAHIVARHGVGDADLPRGAFVFRRPQQFQPRYPGEFRGIGCAAPLVQGQRSVHGKVIGAAPTRIFPRNVVVKTTRRQTRA
jgi:hypothetical protein